MTLCRLQAGSASEAEAEDCGSVFRFGGELAH